jgi:hypothetical protein
VLKRLVPVPIDRTLAISGTKLAAGTIDPTPFVAKIKLPFVFVTKTVLFEIVILLPTGPIENN